MLVGCGNQAATNDPRATETARVTVQKYAFEAYPEWAAAHPDKSCPASLADMSPYMAKDTGQDLGKDPWGHAYKMYCGANVPAGARGLAVTSSGPDGKDGTPDDIQSWK